MRPPVIVSSSKNHRFELVQETMPTDYGALSIAAVSLGFVHCVLGPDHYVPFVAMSRVGLWSLRKTLLVTVLCGVGHLASSVAIGFIGIALGVIVLQLESLEEIRGNLAGWLLVAFGLIYLVWGIIYAIRRLRSAGSTAGQGVTESAESRVTDVADVAARAGGFTPWVLFLIFLFGPCEPLIALMFYPAAKGDVWTALWATILFSATTLATMTALVALICMGVKVIRFPKAEPFGHALAGLIVLACGLGITVFGL
jgi:sulfite exporter TauE/SafE